MRVIKKMFAPAAANYFLNQFNWILLAERLPSCIQNSITNVNVTVDLKIYNQLIFFSLFSFLFVCVFVFFSFLFFCKAKNILIQFRLCGRVSDKKIFTWPIPETRLLFDLKKKYLGIL